MSTNKGPELFFGLVGAVGSQLGRVVTALTRSLKRVEYQTQVVRAIELLHQIEEYHRLMEPNPVDKRYQTYMDAGDKFRAQMGIGDALARLSIGSVRGKRRSINGNPDIPILGCAYIFQSLKHPKEVTLLRRVYGPNFYLLSVYVPRDLRITNLVGDIASSHYESQREQYTGDASRLVERDEYDDDNEFGQKVRNTFPEGDLFIDASDQQSIRVSIDRFVELLFNHQFHTPTKSEYAMYHAQAAAYRSAALGRQVGAAIATSEGDIVAVGTNEVPKFGGGLYWADDPDDGRDHTIGYDVSDRKKKELLAEVLNRFRESGWFEKGCVANEPVAGLLEKSLPLLKSTRLMSLIEFGRAVHAEMAALLDAARRGVAVKGAGLYTTTFPCHDCARHLIAAGIYTVHYIEPYPKSLAKEFHLDSIVIDPAGNVNDKVVFQPFVGIAPRIYGSLFRMTERKDRHGHTIEWQPSSDSMPRLAVTSLSYVESERIELTLLDQRIMAAGLKVSSS